MNTERIGKVGISVPLINNLTEKQLAEITKDLFVLHAEHFLHNNTIIYIALSEHFEEVKKGALIPEYDMIVTATNGVIEKVEYKKYDDRTGGQRE